MTSLKPLAIGLLGLILTCSARAQVGLLLPDLVAPGAGRYSSDTHIEPATDEPAMMDNLVTGPTTQPLPSQQSPVERGIAEFIGHFSAYQPTYFIAGPEDPLVKFQLSFKYRLLNDQAPLAKAVPFLAGIHFSYSQLSLWALDKTSSPFFDTNYQPEFFWSNEDITQVKLPGVHTLGLQTGFGHDSNGQAGASSRTVNMLFLRPILTFGDPNRFHFSFAPKGYIYIGSLSDNPNISQYRGYCDIRATVGWREGLELSMLGRVGSEAKHGMLQLDLTYPIRDLLDKNLDVYIDAQYFNGYGESLLTYNRRTQGFRIGLALVR